MITQRDFLMKHFVKGYNPSEEELEEMKNNLELKGRLSEKFWRMQLK